MIPPLMLPSASPPLQGSLLDSMTGPELDEEPSDSGHASQQRLAQLQACLAQLRGLTSLTVSERPGVQILVGGSEEVARWEAHTQRAAYLAQQAQQYRGSLLPELRELDVTGAGQLAPLVLALVGREALAALTRLRVVDMEGRSAEVGLPACCELTAESHSCGCGWCC